MICPCVVCPGWHVCDFDVTDESDAGMIQSGVPYRVSVRDGTPLCVHPTKIGLPVGPVHGKRLTEHRGRVRIISV